MSNEKEFMKDNTNMKVQKTKEVNYQVRSLRRQRALVLSVNGGVSLHRGREICFMK